MQFATASAILPQRRCKGSLATPTSSASPLVGIAATMLYVSLGRPSVPVTWQVLQGRLGASDKEAALQALETLRKAGAVLEVERSVPGEPAAAAQPKRRRVGQPPSAGLPSEPSASAAQSSERSSSSLVMSTNVEEPAVLVRRSGQMSFPAFKLRPVTEWTEGDAFLDAVKAEHARKESRREKGLRRTQ